MAFVLWRSRRPARTEDAVMTELSRAQADAAARLEAMIGLLAKGQSQLAHTVNERLDSVSHRLGNSLEKTKQSTPKICKSSMSGSRSSIVRRRTSPSLPPR